MYALGYGIFLTNGRILFSSTGISNRVSIVAAAGVAMIWVGWPASSPPGAGPRWSWVVRLAVAALCLSGYLVVHGTGCDLVGGLAARAGHPGGIQARLPALGPGTAIVLDGACPYVGPGMVFESNWDLAGALETRTATRRSARTWSAGT